MSVREQSVGPIAAEAAAGPLTRVNDDAPAYARWARFLPLAGIAASILWIIGFLVMESVRPAAANPTAAEILAYFQDESAVGMGAFAYMLGSIFFIVFVASLWNRLKQSQGDAGGLTALVLTAGAITGLASMFLYGSDLEAHLDADAISASTAEAYYYFGDFWFVGSHLAAAIMLGATGFLTLRSNVLPRWLGWISIVVAVPLLLPPVGWAVMLFVFPLWVVVAALFLVRAPNARRVS